MFFIAFFIVAAACSAITIKTLVGYSDIKLVGKALISGVILVGWFAPLIISVLKHATWLPSKVFAVISFGGYTLLGFAFIIFCLLMLRDITWYGVYGIARFMGVDNWSINPKNISVLSYANMIVVVLSFVIGGYALYEGVKIPEVNNITISTSLIGRNLRLVHLSDLHIDRTTPLSRIRKIIDKVESLAPDVILITGDLIDDDSTVLDDKLEVLKGLSAPYGVYVSIGNHELYNGLYPWMYKYEKMGFKVLFNQGETVAHEIFIAGVPDAHTANFHPNFNINLTRSLEGSQRKQFRILMSHNPEVANSISRYNYQLVLSGHTHGGQIFPFHIFVKKANQYLSGDYKVNDIDLHVSPGAGTWGPSMRLFAPSEIAVIDLIKK